MIARTLTPAIPAFDAAGLPRPARFGAPLFCLICAAVYLQTMNPTIYWGDGIELTAAAAVLGNAHPTGYPLFMQLGKLLSLLPLGTLGWRLNLLSLLPAILLAYFVYQLGLVLFSAWFDPPGRQSGLPQAAALACAASIALSRSLWYQAGVCEVYLLNAAGVCGLVYAALQAWQTGERRLIPAGALAAGVLLGNQLLALCGAAALGVTLLLQGLHWTPGSKKRPEGQWSWKPDRRAALLAAGCGAAGLLIYLHLPLRAAAAPPLNWGNPSSARQFIWSVRGGDFRTQRLLIDDTGTLRPFTPRTWLGFCGFRLKQINNWLAGGEIFSRQHDSATRLSGWGALLFVLALCGCVALARQQPGPALVIAPALLLNLLIVLIYNIEDIDGYFLPLLVWLRLAQFCALLQFGRWIAARGGPRNAQWVVALLLLPLAQLGLNYKYCSHAPRFFETSLRGDRAYAVENYGREILNLAEDQALIITSGDFDIYTLWYMQQVERRRLDVDVVGSNFLVNQPWYHTYFTARRSGAARPDAAPLHWFEFKSIPRSKEEFLSGLREHFIRPNQQHRPVCMTAIDPELGLNARSFPLHSLHNPGVMDHTPEFKYFAGAREFFQIMPPQQQERSGAPATAEEPRP